MSHEAHFTGILRGTACISACLSLVKCTGLCWPVTDADGPGVAHGAGVDVVGEPAPTAQSFS